MKLKHKALAAAFLLAVIIFFQACKKFDFFSNESKTPEFTVAEAKEWYYGVFKKSTIFKEIDYSSPFAPDKNYFTGSQNLKISDNSFFKKFPFWNKSLSYKLGTMQVVEMPIAYEANVLVLPGMQTIASSDRKKIAQASLQKVLFIKKADQTVSVRIVTLIPSLDYLKLKEYDISGNTMQNPDEDFEGIVVIRNWQEKVINVFEVKDAKYKRKINLIKSISQPSTTEKNENNIAHRTNNNCGWVLTTKTKKYCIATTGAPGDQPPADPECPSGEWGEYQTEEWEYIPCEGEDTSLEDCMQMGGSDEQCNCQIYGVGCGNDDPPPPPTDNNQCTIDANNDINNFLNNSYPISEPIPTLIGNETVSSIGEITREKPIEWKVYQGNVLNYNWWFNSFENGVQKKVNNVWKWKSIQHDHFSLEGESLGNTTISLDNPSIISFSSDELYAYIKHNFTITVSVDCGVVTVSRSKRSSAERKDMHVSTP